MVSYKQRLKEFRRPDFFQKQAAVWLDKAVKQKALIFSIGGALILLIPALYAYQLWSSNQRENRLEELAKIEAIYDKEMEAASNKQTEVDAQLKGIESRLEGLKNPDKLKADSPDAKLSADERSKVVKDLEAQKVQLEASLEDFTVDHPDSVKKYEAYFEGHVRTPEGWRAGMRLAEIYLQKRQFEDAARVLAKVLPETTRFPLYHIDMRQSYIGVLEELGRYDDALAQLEILAKENDDELKAKVLLTQAKVMWLKGEKAKAQEYLDKLITEHEKSALVSKAKAFRFVWR